MEVDMDSYWSQWGLEEVMQMQGIEKEEMTDLYQIGEDTDPSWIIELSDEIVSWRDFI